MAWIGHLYEKGLGVKQSHKTAVKWIDKAAKEGNAWAAYTLSGWYTQGNGVKKDLQLAFQWMKLAVERGDVDAIADLGRMYREGIGVEKNVQQAIAQYQLGVSKNDTDSMQELGYELYIGEIVDKDLVTARQMLQKAVDAGNTYRSAYILGWMYNNGEGVAKDLRAAVRYYRLAAEAGMPNAQNILGVTYQYGYGTNQDYDAALSWYKAAADNGNALGQKNYRLLSEQVERNQLEQQRRNSEAAAAQEQLARQRRTLGSMLCARNTGWVKDFQGLYVLGEPVYKSYESSNTITVYVDRTAPPNIQLRVARISSTYLNGPNRGRTVDMDKFDSSWGMLSPGTVFWSDETLWNPC